MCFHNNVSSDLNKTKKKTKKKNKNNNNKISLVAKTKDLSWNSFFFSPLSIFDERWHHSFVGFVSVSKIKSTHLFDNKYMLSFQEAQLMSNW